MPREDLWAWANSVAFLARQRYAAISVAILGSLLHLAKLYQNVSVDRGRMPTSGKAPHPFPTQMIASRRVEL
jgi:hypothetical protein